MPGIPCGTDLIQTTGRDIRWMGGWLRVEEINRWVKVGEAVLQQSDLHQSATEKDSSLVGMLDALSNLMKNTNLLLHAKNYHDVA